MPLTSEQKDFIKNSVGVTREIQNLFFKKFKFTPSTRTIARYYSKNQGKQVVNKKETKVNTIERQPKKRKALLSRVKREAHKELIVSIMRTKVNRGISNLRLYQLAEFVVDQIYKDCRGY